MENTFSWALLIGGLTFFFFGLKEVREALQLLAGDRFKAALGHLVGNRFKALTLGALMTVILQSSSATSVMLVSFASTSLISLKQAIAVLLGAGIGTTVVVVLLSIKKITDYSLVLIAIGFVIFAVAKQRKAKYFGSAILGFGLIFYGMFLMSQAALPLRSSEIAIQMFSYLAENPFASLVLATIFTSIIQTSAATIGLAIALAFAGTINFEQAAPIVLGANIGTCMTALIASYGMGIDGKRVAIAHTLSKIFGVAIIFPFLPQVVSFIESIHITGGLFNLQTGIAGQIALFHLLFNVAVAICFLPLVTPLHNLVVKILPSKAKEKETFEPKYLDESALATPSIAFAHAKREILRIAELTRTLLSKVLLMFSKGEDVRDRWEEIQGDDDKIDLLEKAVRFYLAKISQESLSESQALTQLSLLSISSDLEEIGDIISRELLALSKKKSSWHRIFSEEGWHDLKGFLKMVEKNFDLLLLLMAHPSEELHMKIKRHENDMNEEEQRLRQSHLLRLHKGLKETFDTSSIHLDVLSNLRRINTKLSQIADRSMQE
ncbi:MAG: Na/Pi cotransporter family protein [Pseudomonadota bacterium]